ncbi:Spore germination protein KC, partial [Dissostichus eleginoides]
GPGWRKAPQVERASPSDLFDIGDDRCLWGGGVGGGEEEMLTQSTEASIKVGTPHGSWGPLGSGAVAPIQGVDGGGKQRSVTLVLPVSMTTMIIQVRGGQAAEHHSFATISAVAWFKFPHHLGKPLSAFEKALNRQLLRCYYPAAT